MEAGISINGLLFNFIRLFKKNLIRNVSKGSLISCHEMMLKKIGNFDLLRKFQYDFLLNHDNKLEWIYSFYLFDFVSLA